MTHNIIKTENYLLVVDDSKIKQNDWCIYRTGEVIHYLVKLNTDNLKKIIAHLPLNNSPVLKGVPLLPPLEDGETMCPYPEEKQNAIDWHNGYNKAKEKYKYTEEDLREALFEALNTPKEECCVTHTKDSIVRRVIKSLQQPKMPVAFECEIFEAKDLKSVDEDWRKLGKPKTTTNSQGQTVLAGKYIY
jgi:hypothetical protein